MDLEDPPTVSRNDKGWKNQIGNPPRPVPSSSTDDFQSPHGRGRMPRRRRAGGAFPWLIFFSRKRTEMRRLHPRAVDVLSYLEPTFARRGNSRACLLERSFHPQFCDATRCSASSAPAVLFYNRAGSRASPVGREAAGAFRVSRASHRGDLRRTKP